MCRHYRAPFILKVVMFILPRPSTYTPHFITSVPAILQPCSGSLCPQTFPKWSSLWQSPDLCLALCFSVVVSRVSGEKVVDAWGLSVLQRFCSANCSTKSTSITDWVTTLSFSEPLPSHLEQWLWLQSKAFLQQPLDDRGDGLDSLLLLSCYLPIPRLASTTKF